MVASRLVAAVLWATVLLGLAAPEAARPVDAFPAAKTAVLPVTNGLIRWWPNLFDARDEITGEEGVVMGLLPPVSGDGADETEFDQLSGWAQLRPVVTNQTFTLAFWMRWRSAHHVENVVVLAQEDADAGWRLYQGRLEGSVFHVAIARGREPPQGGQFEVAPDTWHHLVLAFDGAAGRLVCFVDAKRVLDEPLTFGPPIAGLWLTAGNQLKGDTQLGGALRDLCVFDRVLADTEARALYDAGLPNRPARPGDARRRATAPALAIAWQTNVTVAAEEKFIHRRYTTEDGLPDNIVQAVLQTQDLYLWIGTEGGLARFDGRRFRAFTPENTPALAVCGQDISSLAEAADGTLWAGTYGGLLRIRASRALSNPVSRTGGPAPAPRPAPSVGERRTPEGAARSLVSGLEFTAFTNGLPGRFVLQAEPGGDGSVWVAAYRLQSPRGPCRLRRLFPETGTSIGDTVVPGQVRRMVVATNGVWLATDEPAALLFWDGQAASPLTIAKLNERPAGLRLSSGAPASAKLHTRGWINPAADQEQWIEVRCGEAGPVFGWHWKPGAVQAQVVRHSGNRETWLGGEGGLSQVRDGRVEKVMFPNQSSSPNLACVCRNHEGGVWFGTKEDGLHFVQERLVRVFTGKDSAGLDEVRSVCARRGGTLVAAGNGGLDEFHEGRWQRLEALGRFVAVTEDLHGHLWLADLAPRPDALTCSLPEGRRPLQLPGLSWSEPNALRFASDGTLWVACALGVSWVKSEAVAPEAFLGNRWTNRTQFGRFRAGIELPDSHTLGLAEDHEGAIWVGTLGSGLIQVKSGQLTVFTRRDGLPGEFCAPVHCDDSGALWILTEAGLARRRDGRFQVARATDGLPNDLFSDLVEDDLGHFWLPGKRGIHRLERRELEALFDGRLNRVRSLTLGVRDGLLSPECASLHFPCAAKTADGRIWVATKQGLAVFDPRRVELNTRPLPVLIEEVLVNQQPIENFIKDRNRDGTTASLRPSFPLRLKPGSGEHLAIHYAAVSLAAADRVRFRYRLDGYDRDWSAETDLRLAFYTNLRPGQYRFRVKAANSHGIWNDEEARLPFVIAPYLWERPVSWVALALLIAIVAGALHRHRLGVLRRLEELKHGEALASERERIAADMHDQLGSALTQITMHGEAAKERLEDKPEIVHSLDRITQVAREVATDISDLVWAIQPRHDLLEDLAAHAREHAAQQLDGAGIHAQLSFPTALPKLHVSATLRRNLLLVVKEALHNIVKHSGATEAAVQLDVAAAWLVLRIQDNGRGFEEVTPVTRGNGLRNMRRRVQELGGQFDLETTPGQGTRIEVRVPLAKG